MWLRCGEFEMSELTREEQAERDAFEEVMAAHVARLMEFAKPYVSRLNGRDREFFLDKALAKAWERRKEFNPHRASLLSWWDKCLRHAALARPEWVLYYQHDLKFVSGRDLGKRRGK